MAFIDDLLEGGGHFAMKRTEGGASLSPASARASDLHSFQNVVRRVRDNQGDGYAIRVEHESPELPGELVDLVR